MDLQNIITIGISTALSVTTVSAFVIKWSGKLVKFVRIGKDAIQLAEDLLEAGQDGKLDPAEVATFTTDLNKLKADLKS